MAKRKTIVKRKHIRYKPIEAVTAEISLENKKSPFKSDLVGLVFSESYDGCGIVMLISEAVQVGLQCVARVGKLSPLNAEVAWRTEIDPHVIKVGLKYLE